MGDLAHISGQISSDNQATVVVIPCPLYHYEGPDPGRAIARSDARRSRRMTARRSSYGAWLKGHGGLAFRDRRSIVVVLVSALVLLFGAAGSGLQNLAAVTASADARLHGAGHPGADISSTLDAEPLPGRSGFLGLAALGPGTGLHDGRLAQPGDVAGCRR
jgi:hypothetical protein